MTAPIFWICTAIYAAFVFEFGRNLDRKHYPDITVGMVVLLGSLVVLTVEVGKKRIDVPSPEYLAMMVAFAIFAVHYLFRQLQAWARRSGYLKPLPQKRPCYCLEDESMTQRVTSLHKETI